MTPDDFRRIALSFPDTEERSHMGHPDFRVAGGKIFATLGVPDRAWGMVKLTPEQQEIFCRRNPGILSPVPGGWGKGGATRVRLLNADAESLGDAMTLAIRNAAQKKVKR